MTTEIEEFDRFAETKFNDHLIELHRQYTKCESLFR